MDSRVKILRASAGSGKTYRLAYEYVRRVVENPRFYSAILAVTFTNKATAEMKSRILGELNDLAGGRSGYMADLLRDTEMPEQQLVQNALKARNLILHDYSNFSVSTIDKFFQRIVRSFFKELGLDFGYTVELENDSFLGEAVDRLIERSASEADISRIITRIVGEKLDEGKNWDLRPELIALGAELFKEQYYSTDFSADAMQESFLGLKEELGRRDKCIREVAEKAMELMSDVGLEPTDFKQGKSSFASYIARIYRGEAIVKYNSYFGKVMEDSAEGCSKTSPRKDEIMAIMPALTPLVIQIGNLCPDYHRDSTTLQLIGENLDRYLLLGSLLEELRKLWDERSRLPIHETTRLISRLVDYTDVPFIYEKVGNRYENYMIDEFQDTSVGQWHNFLPLVDEAVARSARPSVMLIGDVKQAIYRWRSGDWNILSSLAGEHFGILADSSEQLAVNWRSLSNIVMFNNRLIRAVVDIDNNSLATMLESVPHLARELEGALTEAYNSFEQEVPPHKAAGEGYVQMRPYYSAEQANADILNTVGDILMRGYSQRDIALLLRTKRECRQVADILIRGGYSIVSEEALALASSDLVEFIVSVFRLSLHREDVITIAVYNRYLGREYREPLPQGEQQVMDQLLLQTPIEAIEKVISFFSLGRDSESVSFLQAFYQVLYKYTNENVPDLRLFLDWWDANGAKRSLYLPGQQDAITVMTIHKAKGLEFQCVVIPYADWSMLPRNSSTYWAENSNPAFSDFSPFPINYKKANADSYFAASYYRESVASHIDNVNLLYVALTRAGRELYIGYPSESMANTIAAIVSTAADLVAGIGKQTDDQGAVYYKFGQKTTFACQDSQIPPSDITFDSFLTRDSGQNIRTSWRSERYFAEGGTEAVSPRSRGVMMHSLFERIGSVDDIGRVVQEMILTGDLAAEDAAVLEGYARRAMENPVVGEWFAPGWTVRNEKPILIPGSVSTSRPDRVISRDGQAVVVDYKFGSVQRPGYRRQIKDYMSLMRGMGYDSVRGYIWYVELDKVEQVEF